MISENEQNKLAAKLRCDIIKDLFSQIVKSMKNNKQFYMNFLEDQIKMIFMDSDQQVEIFINLKRQIFVSYALEKHGDFICKYDIKDFDILSLLFQNPKSTLAIQFQQSSVLFEQNADPHNWISYRIYALNIKRQQIPGKFITTDVDQENQNYTTIVQPKLKRLSNVLHTCSLQKIQNIQIRFNSAQSKLQIVPIDGMVSPQAIKDPFQKFSLKVQYVRTQMLDHKRFNMKKLKTCLSLFQKKEGVQLNFYQNRVRIGTVKQETKDIEVIVSCLA